MKIFLLSLLFASFVQMSFADIVNKSKPAYVITHIENPKVKEGKGKVVIQYEDYEELKLIEEETIKKEKVPKAHADKRLAALPKGGFFSVYTYRSSEEAASTKMFTYVFMKNDKEVDRVDGGRGSAPRAPSPYGADGGFWTDIDVVALKEALAVGESVKLYVIDKMGGRDEFTIARK